jgi:hypothetical protein
MNNKNCSLCSALLQGYGHNGEPVSLGRVCDLCNFTFVIPARFNLMNLDFEDDILGEDEQHD